MGRIQQEKEEALRREEAMEEEREPLLSCHREDAYNQVKKRSKLDLPVVNDRQNCVKNNQKNVNNRTNNSKSSRSMTSKVKSITNKSNKEIITRRSPRSPVISKNKTIVSKNKNIGNNCHSNHSNSTHMKRSNTRAVSKPIENGSQTNSTTPSNAGRKSR